MEAFGSLRIMHVFRLGRVVDSRNKMVEGSCYVWMVFLYFLRKEVVLPNALCNICNESVWEGPG